MAIFMFWQYHPNIVLAIIWQLKKLKNNNYIVLDCMYKDLQQPTFPHFIFLLKYAWVLYLHQSSFIPTLWFTFSIFYKINNNTHTTLSFVQNNHAICFHAQLKRVHIGFIVPMHMIAHNENLLHILTQFIFYYKSLQHINNCLFFRL